MNRDEQKLFVSTAVGISFQLGFSALLFAAAMRKGGNAAKWLSDFEEQVVEDARRMRVGDDVPEAVVAETIETVVAEFRQVFKAVRAKVAGARSGRALNDVSRRSGPAGQRIHSCGHR